MTFRQPIFIILLALLSFYNTWGQEGVPYFRHYSSEEIPGIQFHGIANLNDSRVLFADRSGIYLFNGEDWKSIPVNFIPYIIKHDSINNSVFTGGKDNYGVIRQKPGNQFEFQSFKDDTSETIEIMSITWDEKMVYFAFPDQIKVHDRFSFEARGILVPPDGIKIFNIFNINNKLHVSFSNGEIFSLENNQLAKSAIFKYFPVEEEIVFCIPVNKNEQVIGTDIGSIYRVNENKFAKISLEDSAYLKNAHVTGGTKISGENIAIGTVLGGCIIINIQSGKTNMILNYNNGLPDDEIIALNNDISQGLWLSHPKGLTLVAHHLPVRNYSFYPGLEDDIELATILNDTLYVSAGKSLYFLAEKKEFGKKNVSVKVKVKSPSQVSYAEADTKENKEKKAGFFSRLYRKISEPVASVISDKEEEQDKKPDTKQYTYQYRKKTIYTLQSINHQYLKVEGISERATQFVQAGNELLVSTNNGLFAVNGTEASPVIKGEYIYSAHASPDQEILYVISSAGFRVMCRKNNRWKTLYQKKDFRVPVTNMVHDNDQNLLLGSENQILKLITDRGRLSFNTVHTGDKEKYHQYYLIRHNDSIFAIGNNRVSFLNKSGEFVPVKNSINTGIKPVFFQSGKNTWIKTGDGWQAFASENKEMVMHCSYLNLFEKVNFIHEGKNNDAWISTNAGVYRIINKPTKNKDNFQVLLEDIRGEFDLNENRDLTLQYPKSNIALKVVAPFFLGNKKTTYYYELHGNKNSWPLNSTSNYINIPSLAPGNYTLRIKAKNIIGITTPFKEIQLMVNPPFWQRLWFIISAALLFIIGIFFIIKIRERKLTREKRILEEKVIERTREIEEQKEEIEAQRDELTERNEEILQHQEEIMAQRDAIEDQKEEIEKQRDKIVAQNEEIRASIRYAQRIQSAVMPGETVISKYFPEHFIFFRPRDIVSGDFYWIKHKDDKTIIVAADCTGHGVPGAFMSMLGVAFLNEIMTLMKVPDAAGTLKILRNKVIETLAESNREKEGAKDGMDMALLIIDQNKNMLQYAGAFNPLFLIRDGELQEIKADKMPIGFFENIKYDFSNNDIPLQPNDTLYIFSDGFIDQFGGPREKKFKKSPFKKFLLHIHDHPMQKQKKLLEETFDNWKESRDQVDDVLVIGLKI